MLPLLTVLFFVLVAAGAVLYVIDQAIAGWVVAVFASGLAGALVGELFTRERRGHEKADPGGDAHLGNGGVDPDHRGSGEELPGSGGSGAGAGGDVERCSRCGVVHCSGTPDRIVLRVPPGQWGSLTWRRGR